MVRSCQGDSAYYTSLVEVSPLGIIPALVPSLQKNKDYIREVDIFIKKLTNIKEAFRLAEREIYLNYRDRKTLLVAFPAHESEESLSKHKKPRGRNIMQSCMPRFSSHKK